MKSLVALMFGAIILIVIFCGFVLVYTTAQSRPLPDFVEYNQTNQSINRTATLILAPAPAMIDALVPFIILGLVLVPVGILMAVHRGTRPRGFG